jgi:hypothetical protein
MKLGTQTGSLVNHIYANTAPIDPVMMDVVGKPATLLSWTDRSPGTVINQFKKGKFFYIEVQEDNAEFVGECDMSDYQEYVYTRNTDGHITTWRVDNGYRQVYVGKSGRYVLRGTGGLMIGRREKYYDPSF